MPSVNTIVREYARMWSRQVLYLNADLLKKIRERLTHPGVYILYRDEHPYYVGRADDLFKRLRSHANSPQSRKFQFWNYFSAYVVSNSRLLPELESILISSMAMVTANKANPKIQRIALPKEVWDKIRETVIHVS